MTALTAAALLAVGVGAGVAGSLVGAASLITLTALVAMGLPPVTANTCNIVALIPGGISGLYGYRAHLPRDRRMIALITTVVVAGAAVGGVILMVVPAWLFERAVPFVIVAASALVAAQPLMARRRRSHAPADEPLHPRSPDPAPSPPTTVPEHAPPAAGVAVSAPPRQRHALPVVGASAARPAAHRWGHHGDRRLLTAVAVAGVYGGWLNVSLGTVIVALVGSALPRATMQQLNAVRILLSLAISVAAGTVFMATGALDWPVVALVGAGTLVGGWIGARAGQRLRPGLLRALIVCFGVLSAASVALK